MINITTARPNHNDQRSFVCIIEFCGIIWIRGRSSEYWIWKFQFVQMVPNDSIDVTKYGDYLQYRWTTIPQRPPRQRDCFKDHSSTSRPGKWQGESGHLPHNCRGNRVSNCVRLQYELIWVPTAQPCAEGSSLASLGYLPIGGGWSRVGTTFLSELEIQRLDKSSMLNSPLTSTIRIQSRDFKLS